MFPPHALSEMENLSAWHTFLIDTIKLHGRYVWFFKTDRAAHHTEPLKRMPKGCKSPHQNTSCSQIPHCPRALLCKGTAIFAILKTILLLFQRQSAQSWCFTMFFRHFIVLFCAFLDSWPFFLYGKLPLLRIALRFQNRSVFCRSKILFPGIFPSAGKKVPPRGKKVPADGTFSGKNVPAHWDRCFRLFSQIIIARSEDAKRNPIFASRNPVYALRKYYFCRWISEAFRIEKKESPVG
jgi:hypothetical protein